MMRTMSPMKMYSQARPQGEELVLAHLGLVKRVALHLKARVPAYMELDELIQVGMMGLLEASRVFDASKGVDFENFAHSRVRGAMLDEVRRLSFLPRSAVAFNKSHNETLHALSSELGRAHQPRPRLPSTWARIWKTFKKNAARPDVLKLIRLKLSLKK